MKRKSKLMIMAMAALILGGASMAQEQSSSKGKPIITIFGDAGVGFADGEINALGFNLERAYLGYDYRFDDRWSAKVVYDMGRGDDTKLQRLGYVKNAELDYKNGNLSVKIGLTGTSQFNFQEKFWGYRYIRKSFQDEYKFGSSADLGVSATFDFTERFSLDAVILNGEGYKKIQKNDGLNYGLGLTANPVGGFFIRAYGGINQGTEGEQKNTANLASFIGYKHDKFSLGAEFNQMWNTSFKDDEDKNGFSVYANVKMPKISSIYVRFDDIFSKDDWNKSKDESNVIFGSQFKVGKYVKLAPNVRLAMPKQEGADNKWSAYINCSFGL